MGFQLRGTTTPVRQVNGSMDGVMPDKKKVVKVEAKTKDKKAKK